MANSESRDGIHVLDIEHPSPTAEEATQPIRYTAVTCEPEDFKRSGNSLRHYDGGTELVIAITMSNQNKDMFSGTMNSCVAQASPTCAN
jgi:chitin synthase